MFFVLLPNGFAKHLIYQLVPLVVKKMGRTKNPILIVVLTWVALMEVHITFKWGEVAKGERAIRELCRVGKTLIHSQREYTCVGTDNIRAYVVNNIQYSDCNIQFT